MLNLGAHTELACDNDRFQAALTLALLVPVAILLSVMVVLTVYAS